MKFAEAFRVAMQAIVANRLRAGLTTLGVIIGVLAVVLLVAIGQGAREEITGSIEGLGSNLLIVVPGGLDFSQAPARSTLTLRDLDAVERAIGDPGRVAADTFSGEVLRAGNNSVFASVIGATADFDEVVVRELSRGSSFTESDVVTRRRALVIGAGVADALFPNEDPLNKNITIAGLRFRVVGVLERVGGSLFGPDRDFQVLMPITTLQRILGTDRVDGIFVKARSVADIDEERELVLNALTRRLDEDEFSIITQEEIIGVVARVLELVTLLLAAIAGISLLVGGVGVSNIMLVSVSERTREIGLRKAIGARPRDITLQFLIEAVVLTGAGGLLGLVSGVGLAGLVNRFAPIPAVITLWSVLLALGVSIAVGVFFGVWPARRAGMLDPVEALRHE